MSYDLDFARITLKSAIVTMALKEGRLKELTSRYISEVNS